MSQFAIDSTSEVAPYEQVRVQVAQQVLSGALEPGAKLPTVRSLAADLGLANNTVARAFRELEADGVIVTRGRKGSFVNSRVLDAPGAQVAIVTAAAEYATLARAHGLTLSETTGLIERAWSKP